MNAANWLASAAGLAVIATCAILLHFAVKHEQRIHQRASLWVYRLLIFGMYVGGCAVAVTALGAYVIGLESWAVNSLAGLLHAGPGAVYVACLAAGLVSFLVAALGIWLEPYPVVAWWALAVPFVCALSGGHLHGVLTIFPVTEWASQVSSWIGGGPGAHG